MNGTQLAFGDWSQGVAKRFSFKKTYGKSLYNIYITLRNLVIQHNFIIYGNWYRVVTKCLTSLDQCTRRQGVICKIDLIIPAAKLFTLNRSIISRVVGKVHLNSSYHHRLCCCDNPPMGIVDMCVIRFILCDWHVDIQLSSEFAVILFDVCGWNDPLSIVAYYCWI